MARINSSPSAQAIDNNDFFIKEIPTGAVNGSNKTYTLDYEPTIGADVVVYVQGQKQILSSPDYTISGTTLTTTIAWPTGAIIEVQYNKRP